MPSLRNRWCHFWGERGAPAAAAMLTIVLGFVLGVVHVTHLSDVLTFESLSRTLGQTTTLRNVSADGLLGLRLRLLP